MNRTRLLAAAVGIGLLGLASLWAGRERLGTLRVDLPDTVFLEEMTWLEVQQALRQGMTAAIVPTGGVEQNGPHMILGKHNHVVRHTAGRIAEALGDALVAPVVSYVPEGSIDPPAGHMHFPGTISIPEPVFEAILENTARSLKAHGFQRIYLVGDSGGNQASQARIADRLAAEWAASEVTVAHIGDYYAANGQTDWLLAEGETRETIGTHAGIRDTSELLAVHPEGIREDMLRLNGKPPPAGMGVAGDPALASVERGRQLLDLKVQAALRQIRLIGAD